MKSSLMSWVRPEAQRLARVPAIERATLSVSEAAAMLGISRDAAYDAARRGELPTLRFGRRVLVSKAVLDRILAGEPLPPSK